MKRHTLLFVLLILGMGWLHLSGAPVSLTQEVVFGGKTNMMRLTRLDLRGPNFELWAQNSAGGYDVISPVSERSYIGTVDDIPAAVACGILKDDGRFWGAIYFDRGASWFTLGSQVYKTRAVGYGPDDFTAFSFPTAPTAQTNSAGTNMIRVDVGMDVRSDFYSSRAGSSVTTAFEMVEHSAALVRPIYMANTLIRPYLARVIIRTSAAQDPCAGLTADTYLATLRSHWNTSQTTADRDVVAGVDVSSVGGGLGYQPGLGLVSTYGFSVSDSDADGSFDVIWRHELGHNWNCGHYEGDNPEGAGILGGNQPAHFSGCEVYKIIGYRINRLATGTILDNEGVFSAINLPPYAAMDTYELAAGSTNVLDVLANDFDANGGPVSLDSVDAISAKGGRCEISPGSGPGGRNQICYRPSGTLGTDYIRYRISDASGQTATGVAIIKVGYGTGIYEAEFATLSGPTVTSFLAGYYGTGYARYAHASGDYVQWSVNVPAAGDYPVSFRFLNGNAYDRPLELKVNGVAITNISFPPMGSSTWTSTVPQLVTLLAGTNLIRTTSIGSNGANIDFLKVVQTTDTSAPQDPYFYWPAFTRGNATAGVVYRSSVTNAVNDPNPGSTFVFAKIAGPGWLSVVGNGSLSGLPAASDVGLNSFLVKVTDATGRAAQAILTITVEPAVAAGTPVAFYGAYQQTFDTDLANSSTVMPSGFRAVLIAGGGGTFTNGTAISAASMGSATLSGTQTLTIWDPPAAVVSSSVALFNCGTPASLTDRALGSNPTGVAAMAIQLTMTNRLGRSLDGVIVNYDVKCLTNGTGGSGLEDSELPGYTFFYSTTGGTGAADWIRVEALSLGNCTAGTTMNSGNVTIVFPTPLTNNGTLYFRWADDNNLNCNPDQTLAIDNLSVLAYNPMLPALTGKLQSSILNLNWPAGYPGWFLYTQTNSLTGTWYPLVGLQTNAWNAAIQPNCTAVFFNLKKP